MYNNGRTLEGNEVIDHSGVVGAAQTGVITPGYNGSGNNNFKARWATFKFWELVRLL